MMKPEMDLTISGFVFLAVFYLKMTRSTKRTLESLGRNPWYAPHCGM